VSPLCRSRRTVVGMAALDLPHRLFTSTFISFATWPGAGPREYCMNDRRQGCTG
jgi:hypothetical protein